MLTGESRCMVYRRLLLFHLFRRFEIPPPKGGQCLALLGLRLTLDRHEDPFSDVAGYI